MSECVVVSLLSSRAEAKASQQVKELEVVVASLQQSLQANQLKHSKITASLASLSCGPEEGQSEQRSPVGRHSATGDTSARECVHVDVGHISNAVTIMAIVMIIIQTHHAARV